MTITSSESRAATGVQALDDILNGGFTRGHMYLLEGEPGAGKTTLATQFLLSGAADGEAVLYVTLSESEAELRFSAASHGWSLDGITIMELTPLDGMTSRNAEYTVFDSADVELDDTLDALREHVDRVQPGRIVIDSLAEVKLLARDPLRFRREILVLKQYFLQKNTTVLLLDDRWHADSDVQIQSLVHGVVRLERLANEFGAERRRLMVSKMRGSQYRGGYHDYKIATGGLAIYPRLVAAEHRASRLPGTLLSGVANLDSLLGGGLEHGTSTLIIGPSGTGKSTIATTYALAHAEAGGRCAMFLFDENLATLLARCDSLNLPLRTHIDGERVLVHQFDPAEVSPGEMVQIVRDLVEDDVKVIVFDSLIGLLNAMPEEKMLLTQLHELLSFLSQRGVTTLMTMVQHGIVGPTSSPADLSYLADSLVLLRYFEAKGEVRQAISVLKKRTGNHEKTIREMRIERGGVTVGQPLTDFQGILTGTPIYVGLNAPLMNSRSEASHA